jgi:lysophospholipid acyltransferase (LPLAT)-like uncharacterized protein
MRREEARGSVHQERGNGRYWTVQSRDRTQIPKPWSRVRVAIGAPIEVVGTAAEALAASALANRLAGVEAKPRVTSGPADRL